MGCSSRGSGEDAISWEPGTPHKQVLLSNSPPSSVYSFIHLSIHSFIHQFIHSTEIYGAATRCRPHSGPKGFQEADRLKPEHAFLGNPFFWVCESWLGPWLSFSLQMPSLLHPKPSLGRGSRNRILGATLLGKLKKHCCPRGRGVPFVSFLG